MKIYVVVRRSFTLVDKERTQFKIELEGAFSAMEKAKLYILERIKEDAEAEVLSRYSITEEELDIPNRIAITYMHSIIYGLRYDGEPGLDIESSIEEIKKKL